MKFLLLAFFCGICVSSLGRAQSSDGIGRPTTIAGQVSTMTSYLVVVQDFVKVKDVTKFDNEIAQIRSQIQSVNQLPFEVAYDIMSKVHENIDAVALKIGSFLNENGHDLVETAHELRDDIEIKLMALEGQIKQSTDLESLFGAVVKQIRSQYVEFSKKPACDAGKIQSYLFVQGITRRVSRDVAQKITGVDPEEVDRQIEERVKVLRNHVAEQLDLLESQATSSLVLSREFGLQVTALRSQQQAASRQPIDQALRTLIALQDSIKRVQAAVKSRIEGGIDY